MSMSVFLTIGFGIFVLGFIGGVIFWGTYLELEQSEKDSTSSGGAPINNSVAKNLDNELSEKKAA